MKRGVITVLLLAVLVMFPGTARAEDGNLNLGGGSNFMMGLSFLGMGELNESLTSQGYPELPGVMGMWGGGGYGFVGRLMLGGEGFGGIQVGADGSRVSTYAVGGGMFELGYAVVAGENAALFPYFGIGAAGVGVTAGTHDSSPLVEDFAGGLLLRLGVGGHYRLRFADDHSERGSDNLMFSFRLGYNMAVGDSWTLHNLPGKPSASMSGPFIIFTIGGTGFHVPDIEPFDGHDGDTIIIFGH